MNTEEIYFWRAGLSDEPLEEEREAMTAEEITKEINAVAGSKDAISGDHWEGFSACAFWLREIAYQLAVMNERAASQPTFVFPSNPEFQKGQNT